MMSCISKNKTYYDWWALRHSNSWFNKNIFSCEANNCGVVLDSNHSDKKYEYEYKKRCHEFYDVIQNSTLINVHSAFNGFAIYKLSSMKNCYYSANYKCSKCNGKNRGCWEDNDHIGLHNQMVKNGSRLFINTKLCITNIPENATFYNHYILSNKKQIENLDKNPLTYLLSKNIANKNGVWLELGMKNEEISNQLSKYIENPLYVYNYVISSKNNKDKIKNNTTNNTTNNLFLNKNIQLLKEKKEEKYNKILSKLPNNVTISFIYVHPLSYQSIKQIFISLIDKITHDCVIVFQEFINYPDYFLHEYKVFYELSQEYNIKYKFIGMNGTMDIYLTENETITNKNNKMVAISIIHNPLFIEDTSYITDILTTDNKTNNTILSINIPEDFDWKYYANKYGDLQHATEEEARDHWITHGYKEGRVYNNKMVAISIIHNPLFMEDTSYMTNVLTTDDKTNSTILPINIPEDFDWKYYANKYGDLQHATEKEACDHWITHGYKEGRVYKNDKLLIKDIEHFKYIYLFPNFDWKYYVNKYCDLQHATEKEACEHWITHGYKEGRVYRDTENYNNFNWQYYVNKYDDLSHIKTMDEALEHWERYGKIEGRFFSDFDWYLYLKLNNELIDIGISTKEEVLKYYLNHL